MKPKTEIRGTLPVDQPSLTGLPTSSSVISWRSRWWSAGSATGTGRCSAWRDGQTRNIADQHIRADQEAGGRWLAQQRVQSVRQRPHLRAQVLAGSTRPMVSLFPPNPNLRTRPLGQTSPFVSHLNPAVVIVVFPPPEEGEVSRRRRFIVPPQIVT